MPRIYTSQSNPLDFCRDCFPPEAEARALYGDLGAGPDGRGNCFGYDDAHPAYAGENYRCVTCGRPLGDDDDDPAPARAEKRLAYFLLETEKTRRGHWGPCIAVENEPGYYRTDYDFGPDKQKAQAAIDELNARRGLTPREAALIQLTTMRPAR